MRDDKTERFTLLMCGICVVTLIFCVTAYNIVAHIYPLPK